MTTVRMDPRIRARRVEVLRLRGRRRLRWAVLVASTLAATLFAWWILTGSPLFEVDEVVVQGTDQTSVERVVVASGISIGQPLVEVDLSVAHDAIAALPWVLDVSSDRSATGQVSFVITERLPVATIAGPDGWLVVDGDGRILDAVSVLPDRLVVFEGLAGTGNPGGWLGADALPALEVAKFMPVGLASRVASISSTGSGLELVLFGGGKVLLGDATELESKFLAALTLLVRVDLDCLESVDVGAPTVPVLTRLADCP